MKIRMIIGASTVALAACTTPLAPYENDAALHDRLVAMEKQAWIAWQHHDASYFSSALSGDHLDVSPRGVVDKSAVLSAVGGGACTVDSYSLDQIRVQKLSSDAYLLVYRATQSAQCGGTPVPSPTWVSSLYVHRADRWVNVLFQQSPAASN